MVYLNMRLFRFFMMVYVHLTDVEQVLDAASGGTFMSKYEDEALELIELVAENSHHHAAKSFEGRSAPVKGGMLDAKAAETYMLLDKIEKLMEA